MNSKKLLLLFISLVFIIGATIHIHIFERGSSNISVSFFNHPKDFSEKENGCHKNQIHLNLNQDFNKSQFLFCCVPAILDVIMCPPVTCNINNSVNSNRIKYFKFSTVFLYTSENLSLYKSFII